MDIEQNIYGWLDYIGDGILPMVYRDYNNNPWKKDPVINQPVCQWKVVFLFFSWLNLQFLKVNYSLQFLQLAQILLYSHFPKFIQGIPTIFSPRL